MKIFLLLLTALLMLAAVFYVLARRGPNLATEYRRQMAAEADARDISNQPVITEEGIAALPEPVRRYIRFSGAIDKPRVASAHVFFDAELFQKPGQKGMAGPAEQYDRFAGPKRLFFMQTTMYGLKVNVLHDYTGTTASMRVRIASLIDVANNSSEELARAETVTILNDLCLFAPSWLSDPRLTWEPIDHSSVRVTFANGPYVVSATLVINELGEVINFISDDRAAMQLDGTLQKLRWSTPMSEYRDFNGRRYPTFGRANYDYPTGPFTYGIFRVRDVRVN